MNVEHHSDLKGSKVCSLAYPPAQPTSFELMTPMTPVQLFRSTMCRSLSIEQPDQFAKKHVPLEIVSR
jgi:hypothetical protein